MCDCWQISHFIPKSINLGQKKISRLCLDITYKGKVLHYSSTAGTTWPDSSQLDSTSLDQTRLVSSRPDSTCLVANRLILSQLGQTYILTLPDSSSLNSARLISFSLDRNSLVLSLPHWSCLDSTLFIKTRPDLCCVALSRLVSSCPGQIFKSMMFLPSSSIALSVEQSFNYNIVWV